MTQNTLMFKNLDNFLFTNAIPEKIKEILLPEKGLVLITGITGSGKSTLLQYVLSDLLCKSEENCVNYTDFAGDFIETSQGRIAEIINEDIISDTDIKKYSTVVLSEIRSNQVALQALKIKSKRVYGILHAGSVYQAILRVNYLLNDIEPDFLEFLDRIHAIVHCHLFKSRQSRVMVPEYICFPEPIKKEIREVIKKHELSEIKPIIMECIKNHGMTRDQSMGELLRANLITAKEMQQYLREKQ